MADKTTADVENFRLSHLGEFGIVVNPQWTVASLQPEDLFLISAECTQKILESGSSKKSSSSDSNSKSAVLDWISENSNDNAQTVFDQIVSDAKSLPKKLPADAKQRFDACSTISQILKTLFGVPDHLDYSVFMYPNEKKTRDLISALLERMSDHSDRVRNQQQSSKQQGGSKSTTSSSGGAKDTIAAAFARSRNTNAFARPEPRRLINVSTAKKAGNLTTVKKPDQVISTALQQNAIRRLVDHKQQGSKGAQQQQQVPQWALNHLKLVLGKNFQLKNKKQKSELDVYGSLADVAPEQAAAQEREAAEIQARLRSAEADVEKLKLSVEDAQKARELEDADLSDKLKNLKSGIKHFKNKIKEAKTEMEQIEKTFVDLENTESEDLAKLEASLAEILARRSIIDGVDQGGEEYVQSLSDQLDSVAAEHAELLRDVENKLNKQKKKQKSLRDKILAMGPSKKDLLVQLQADCKKLTQECRAKFEEFEALESEHERSKAKTKIKIDREVLSRMIYDVTVSRHMKQDRQIYELVNEIGLSERRINDLSQAISKRYGEIETEMYATAQVDTAIRDLFPPLVGLRGEYVNLVKRISELGKVRKEKHDVESRLNKLMRFSESSMLESAERDLKLVTESIKSVQKEIEQLTASKTVESDDI